MLHNITRRAALALSSGGLAAATFPGGNAGASIQAASVTPPQQPVEQGASLRVLRPTKFVDPDEVIFRENTRRFTEATGVQVRVDFAGWEDVRPQTAVAANTGAGPDIVVGWRDDPHLYAEKILDLSELAGYLGARYGGWMPLALRYGRRQGTDHWISIPVGATRGPCVYRDSWVRAVGYESIPAEHDRFLDLCRKLKASGHPPGFALGNAVGDGNGLCNWLLWSHGGSTVDEEGKPVINSPATVEALRYGKELYQTFIPGTVSWGDISNNRAFSAGEISLTSNGVSLYFSLKNDPATAAIAADTEHAELPFGRAGKPAEAPLLLNAMVFRHTRYPNASKEYLRFMMEADQYDRWLTGCMGYWAHPLRAYGESEVWRSDPKITLFRTSCDAEFWDGYKGPISAASGAVTADYVVVQMFAAVATGQATPDDAAREAERRIRRYYRR